MASPSPRGRPGRAATTKVLAFWALILAFTASQSFTADPNPARKLIASSADGTARRFNRQSQPVGSPAEIPLLIVDSATAKYRSTDDENNNADRFRALAPALDVVRAPLVQTREPTRLSALTAGARLLQDWEVENIVLLATIDGAIHARDRKTGQERWSLGIPDSPMIETIHHRPNRSSTDEPHPEDDYIFIVEPSKDGNLYIQHKDPRQGLQRLGITVRSLAAQTPQFVESPALVTIAEQKTMLFTIDASSGNVLKKFDKGDTFINDNQDRSCRRLSGFELDDEACEPIGTLMLGRVQYTITISSEAGDQLCTIKYSEWTPNTRDSDLQSQYVARYDNYRILSFHNGKIMGVDDTIDFDKPYRFFQTLETPVAQVFDVVRPKDTKGASAPLVVLSQPADQTQQSTSLAWYEGGDTAKVFVNKTETGGWFAMSEFSYPGVTSQVGPANLFRGIDTERRLIDFDADSNDMVGVHRLSQPTSLPPILTIGGPTPGSEVAEKSESEIPPVSQPKIPMLNLESLSGIPPVLFAMLLVLFTLALSNRDKLALMVQDYLGQWGVQIQITRNGQELRPFPSRADQTTTVVAATQPEPSELKSEDPTLVEDKNAAANPRSRAQSSAPDVAIQDSQDKALYSGSDAESDDFVRIRSDSPGGKQPRERADSIDPDKDLADEGNGQDGKKRRTKRGKRGGKNNKKKKTMEPEALDESTNHITAEIPLKDDWLQVGRLRVNIRPETCLGHGSNGTTVYLGELDQRQVAVKRLLRSTNSLAAKEIKHLLSSDDHPNVIRYFGKEESHNFTFIALDLFTSSLDQLIEHPERYTQLISMTDGLNVKDALRQITYGVQHLHSLKLVHRDIKPQNVLVRPLKSHRPTVGPPKLQYVISDFGLCKDLDEGPGSFFAPTDNHTAAGTTGWRAPELLVRSRSIGMTSDSVSSESSKPTSSSADVTLPPGYTGRRATKAIDVFSLGCVFFYVMTQGCHPYDSGGTSLGRDLNIQEDKVNTGAMRLHNYQFDADDLVLQMLKHQPAERPDTLQILRHPYFWTESDKLDFLCDVSDGYEREKALDRPPSEEIGPLENIFHNVYEGNDFLKVLPRNFITEVGKQRKYSGNKMIDLLRMIRNKRHHFHDLPDDVKDQMLGGSIAGYYNFWAKKFPSLLINCHCLIIERGLVDKFKLQKYFE